MCFWSRNARLILNCQCKLAFVRGAVLGGNVGNAVIFDGRQDSNPRCNGEGPGGGDQTRLSLPNKAGMYFSKSPIQRPVRVPFGRAMRTQCRKIKKRCSNECNCTRIASEFPSSATILKRTIENTRGRTMQNDSGLTCLHPFWTNQAVKNEESLLYGLNFGSSTCEESIPPPKDDLFYLVAILHCFVGPVGWPHAFHPDCSSEWLDPMMPTVGVFTQHIPCLAPHSPREERAPDGDVYGKGIAAFKARPVLMKDVPTTPLATCALFTVRVCIYSQHCLPVYTWFSFSTAVNADWLGTMTCASLQSN